MINLNKPPSHAVYGRMSSANELERNSSLSLFLTRKRVKLKRELAHTLGFPGIPTSHSIRFMEPSAAFAGLA